VGAYQSLFRDYPVLFLTSIAQANSFGVEFDLVRISVGLEEASFLRTRVQHALDAVAKAQKK
jgi:cystathionine beta-lyase/cystathionine gamma-synthase